VVQKLNAIEGYKKQFQAIFGSDATPDALAQAIAAYERTVVSGNAPFDKFKAGDESALSDSARRGMDIFFGKGACSSCHVGPTFTDHAFHNVGVGMDKEEFDRGRVAISNLKGDTGAFKTPSLRDISRTAPYMHDGSLKTLEDVVEYYDKGGIPNDFLDEEIFPLKLSDQEKQDLINFLTEGLTSEDFPDHKPPALPE
jgi:cytochrome c peroxidase